MTINKEKLAINGGKKTVNCKLSKYNTFDSDEVEAATSVIKSGVLSDFIGALIMLYL